MALGVRRAILVPTVTPVVASGAGGLSHRAWDHRVLAEAAPAVRTMTGNNCLGRMPSVPVHDSACVACSAYEHGLIEALCAQGGMRAQPPRDKLVQFVQQARTLEPEVCTLIYICPARAVGQVG